MPGQDRYTFSKSWYKYELPFRHFGIGIGKDLRGRLNIIWVPGMCGQDLYTFTQFLYKYEFAFLNFGINVGTLFL